MTLYLEGQKFGRLEVIYEVPALYNRKTYYCVCDCGGYTVVLSKRLTSGKTKSCGCLRKENTSKSKTTHGMSKSRTYSSYESMKTRCLNENNPKYPYYGGRGITISNRWLLSFENFLEDMGERPEGRTLDRINNDLGYCKENCRWATPKEQANNRRRK